MRRAGLRGQRGNLGAEVPLEGLQDQDYEQIEQAAGENLVEEANPGGVAAAPGVGVAAVAAPVLAPELYQQFVQFQQFQAFIQMQAQPMQVSVLPLAPIQGQGMVDPGMWIAMSQVRPPTLLGIQTKQIKQLRLEYSRYEARCILPQFKQHPGRLVLADQLAIIARSNGLPDNAAVLALTVDDFSKLYVRCITLLWLLNGANTWKKLR